MKRGLPILAVALMLGLNTASSRQQHFSDAGRAAEAAERKIKAVMPEWESDKITPASAEENRVNDKVSVRQWRLNNKNVRVAVVQHQSVEEAAKALRQFAADKRTTNTLPGLGDEAFRYGMRGAIAFRQGNLTVYVSAVVINEVEIEEARVNKEEARNKASKAERDEEVNVTRGFAHHVAAALKAF